MDADRQHLVVDCPKILENQLGEAPRVAEDERRPVVLDQLHHLAHRVSSGMAAPRDLVLGGEDREVGLGAGIADHEVDLVHIGIRREPATVGVGVADRRGQADSAQARRQLVQA